MKQTTIRLRPDQVAFITQVTKEKATDLSAFVRLCVDSSAIAVAQNLPDRLGLLQMTPEKSPMRSKRILTVTQAKRLAKVGGAK